ncbi:MAG TPA: hypothetical protein ENK18_04190 [Deltaproteobacteria bacterium]|nr:hypothetical protein [Deltaproteobacteria bacterium]
MDKTLWISVMALLTACTPPKLRCDRSERVLAWVDADGDGFGRGSPEEVCALGDGMVDNATDCNDDDASVFPGAEELCDGVDNDCDGRIDQGLPTLGIWYPDLDGDGFGAQYPAQEACADPGAGWVDQPGDCDDNNADVNPDAIEICNGSLDDDCDGLEDELDPSLSPASLTTFYRDADLDGYGNSSNVIAACDLLGGYAAVGGDCDDTRRGINPSATEICNGRDDDCDSRIDDDDPSIDPSTQQRYYIDADLDGYGLAGVSTLACTGGPGLVNNDRDCDDGAPELNWDDKDSDGVSTCEGDCDDFAPLINPIDLDGDGVTACDPAPDCDPVDGMIHPNAPEIPADGIDQDCDTVDDCYLDSDNDGYGVQTVVVGQTLDCSGPNESNSTDDCDDDDDFITNPHSWYDDADLDGYGSGFAASFGCYPHDSDASAYGTDCDESDPTINPGMEEICGDTIDNDCNTETLDPCVYIFSGILTNIPETDLTGWELCWSGRYNGFENLSDIQAQCDKANLLMTCRPIGSANLTVAAQAPRADVLFPTGQQNVTHNANGVGWYFDNSYSWGFAEPGDGLSRNSCDTATGSFPERRLCWHTGGNAINGGWRCGSTTNLNSSTSWVRALYHADF